MKPFALFTALTLSLASAVAQVAGPPAAIDYQGRVLDGSGAPVAPGQPQNIEMYFRIWDDISSGSLIWAEKQIVTVFEGNFSVRLGEGSPIESSAGDNVLVVGTDDPRPSLYDAFGEKSRFLGLTVAADSNAKPTSEILPRLAFLSSPFSIVAERARYAEFGPEGGTFEAGRIGVGIDSPVAPLHVHGSSTFGTAFGASGSNATNILNILAGENASGASNGITFFEDSNASSGMSFGYDGVGAGSPALRLYGFDDSPLVSFGADGDVGIGTEAPGAALHVKRPDGGVARIYATGSAQGSGEIYAGESVDIGGGFAFHGDNQPSPLGGQDRIVFFRRNDGDSHEVFSYGYDKGDVRFAGHGRFAGHVGVGGAESETHQLHVVGDSNSTGSIFAGERIGIGTDTPQAQLHIISTSEANMGAGTGALLIGDEAGANLIFDRDEIAARSNGEPALLRLNPHGGNVRIGNNDDRQYGRFSVNGVTNVSLYNEHAAELHARGHGQGHWGTRNIAIGTNGYMRAIGMYGVSDARIKNVIGVSDSTADLDTLLEIEVADYTHVDFRKEGSGEVKKVIAQQVEKVFPQAVRHESGTVPDIYRSAPFSDGWVEMDSDLKAGDRVKLIALNGTGTYEVLETRDGAFRTNFESTEDKVFVYGREVNDFRSVDYDAIAMLNVSATQALYRRLSSQTDDLATKTEQISALEDRLAAIERRLAGGEYVTATVAK